MPAGLRGANDPIRLGRGVCSDGFAVWRLHVRFGGALQHHEETDRLIDGGADGEQAVVAQQDRLRIAEGRPDPLAAIAGDDVHFFVVENLVVLVERA